MSKAKKKRLTKTGLSIYRAKDGWRWRWVHENYKLGAEGGEAYSSKLAAKRGWQDFLDDLFQHRMVMPYGLD